jgi:hypothetical protein
MNWAIISKYYSKAPLIFVKSIFSNLRLNFVIFRVAVSMLYYRNHKLFYLRHELGHILLYLTDVGIVWEISKKISRFIHHKS